MPPKKAKTATAATPARASRSAAPATVTTTRGKEIETTAAISRPRRVAVTATTTAATPVKAKKSAKAPAKSTVKAATKAAATPASTKKRGRPAKAQDDEGEPPKKRGRPSTKPAAKASAVKPAAKKTTARKTKALDPEEAPDAPDTPAPRKRHSGPKGGETTKISTDDGAAADQLEEELVETAENATKRKAPAAKKGKGKAAVPTSGKQYWLLKAEQIDREETLKSGRVFNSKFTIDDLKNRTAPEPWDGVRNLVARNNMRAMSKGDLAFFYASQAKGKLQPGITGIMEIVKEAEPDQSVYDEDHYGFVEPDKRRDENQWSLVHVEFRKKLKTPVTLKELQKFGKTEGGVLSNMEVLKQSRLSVTKVTEAEWNFIVDKIISDEYEEDADAGDEVPTITASEAPTKGAVAVDPPVAKAPSRAASLQPSLALPLPVVQSTEVSSADAIDSGFPTSEPAKPASRAGSLKPASRAGSVKPASRAGSVKPASRAGSVKPSSRAPSVQPASRAGSLAPVRASSRGRSRTPKPAGIEEPLVEQHDQLNSIMEEDGL